MIHVLLSQLSPAGTILAGALQGEYHAQTLIALAATQDGAAVSIVLDLQGVEAVTASYLKALFKAFASREAEGGLQIYPLVANLGKADLRYELESYLNARDLAAQAVQAVQDSFSPTEILGKLDPSATDAYQQLQSIGPSTAAHLHERNPKAALGQTTWNNRLMRLFELRLVHRTRSGRNWVYQPAFNL